MILDFPIPVAEDVEENVKQSLCDLRKLRVEMAKAQLDNVEQTVDELIDRGMAKKNFRNRLIRETSSLLVEKIVSIHERTEEESPLYFDELLLYLDLMPDSE